MYIKYVINYQTFKKNPDNTKTIYILKPKL